MRIRYMLCTTLLTATAAALPLDGARSSLSARAIRAPQISTHQKPLPATPADMARVLTDVHGQQKDLKVRLAKIRRDEHRNHEMTIVRGRAYVRLARAGLLPIGGGFDALVSHASRLERLRRALARDLDRESLTAAAKNKLTAQLREFDARARLLETERGALRRSKEAILAAQDREMSFRRAFESNWQASAHTAVYAAGFDVSTEQESAGIAEMKGRLPFPIAGRAEISRVRLPSANGPGIQVDGAIGATVRAIFRGRVAFADEYPDYGKTVIVDHGDNHYTVSAQLGSIDVQAGDELAAGDRIGLTSASTKRHNTGTMYLEIRRGTKTTNPSAWFGI